MTLARAKSLMALVMIALASWFVLRVAPADTSSPPAGRSEVVFWHFWGGKYRKVVSEIVRRFNDSQNEHYVREIVMPGNNLDVKFLLSVVGNAPPDLLNQDDPVVADWAYRGAIMPLDELAGVDECGRLREWLFPAARAIGTYQDRLYALCNGLDIRALYYDERVLETHGLTPPQTIAELDAAAQRITPPHLSGPRQSYGYLPDPRRIWAWGIVFGGEFYDASTRTVTVDSEPVVKALDWMASYSRRYGAEQVVRFRKGDQALPGAAFPLLEGRYAMILDGQWRVAELAEAEIAARRAGHQPPRYGVVPLPVPPGGRSKAGWVNGNFFVVPRGAKNRAGAWAFMKFWNGFDGHEAEAAAAGAAGGWIPASPRVVEQPAFQDYLRQYPLFATFVDLAGSPNQAPTPNVPGATYFQDEVIRAAEAAMYELVPPREALRRASVRVRQRLEALHE